MVAPLDAGSTVETRTAVGHTPLHEALAARAGESHLARTVESRLGPFKAAPVVQTRSGVAWVGAMLTVGSAVTSRACAVVAVDVIDTRAAIETSAATSTSSSQITGKCTR